VNPSNEDIDLARLLNFCVKPPAVTALFSAHLAARLGDAQTVSTWPGLPEGCPENRTRISQEKSRRASRMGSCNRAPCLKAYRSWHHLVDELSICHFFFTSLSKAPIRLPDREIAPTGYAVRQTVNSLVMGRRRLAIP
jgi:hypothetical protein